MVQNGASTYSTMSCIIESRFGTDIAFHNLVFVASEDAEFFCNGVYGLVATLRFHAGAFTYADVAVPVVAGAALAAIVASALCRMIQMWQLMRSARNQPMNDVLCYRGVQCLPPVPRLMPDCESPNAPVNGELCYRGTPVSPSISNSEWEIHHSPVDVTLCYRGNNRLSPARWLVRSGQPGWSPRPVEGGCQP